MEVVKVQNEKGNALFLILIAVALFAALSYAVTQSGRGGGGIDKEQTLIEMAQWTQAVANIRGRIQQMVLTGTAPADIKLCPGAACFITNSGTVTGLCSTGEDCLWAPEGGDLDPPTLSGFISFREISVGNSIDGVGTANADIVALFMKTKGVGLSADECRTLNRGYNVSTTLLEEATSDLIYGDGLAVSGEWDYCYDLSTTGTIVYSGVHALYAD